MTHPRLKKRTWRVPVPVPSACKRAVRLRENLLVVAQVVEREGLCGSAEVASLRKELLDHALCGKYLQVWKGWIASCAIGKREHRRRWLQGIDKGSRTLFDGYCHVCHRGEKEKAVDGWKSRVLKPGSTDGDVLEDVRRRVRALMGGGRWWCRGESDPRRDQRTMVPDQKGCLETEAGDGGTFATALEDEEDDPARLRVIATLSKAKFRVVTMQPARVKNGLQVAMEAAYNWISAQPWCVRGGVTREHFRSLGRLLSGQSYVSGDFVASTDYLHLDAVCAVVDVLADDLPDHEAELLRRSFRCRLVDPSGEGREDTPLVRGSMMGSKFSFVVLCLLNKISLDRALGNPVHFYRRAKDEEAKWETFVPGRRQAIAVRPVLVNGDDCCFRACEEERRRWELSAGSVGFVVNRDKTGVSTSWAELNSRSWSRAKGRLIKKPSFGFLAPLLCRDSPADVFSALISTLDDLKRSTSEWLLGHPVVQRAFGVLRPSVSEGAIPERWWRYLVRRRYFRNLFVSPGPDSTPEKVVVDPRVLPMTVGPPHHDDELTSCLVSNLEEEQTRLHVATWRGVKSCCPVPPRSPRVPEPRRVKGVFVRRVKTAPTRLWVTPVLDWFRKERPDLLCEDGCSSSRFQTLTPSYTCLASWPPARPPRHYPHFSLGSFAPKAPRRRASRRFGAVEGISDTIAWRAMARSGRKIVSFHSNWSPLNVQHLGDGLARFRPRSRV